MTPDEEAAREHMNGAAARLMKWTVPHDREGWIAVAIYGAVLIPGMLLGWGWLSILAAVGAQVVYYVILRLCRRDA